IKVVSDGDVQAAQQRVAEQDQDGAKNELRSQFQNNSVLIEESFTVHVGDPQVSPAVGEEATRAELTVETTYTMLGLKRDEVNRLLDTTLAAETEGREDQRIYENGVDALNFSDYEQAQGGSLSVRLRTTGQIGPNIEDDKIAEEVEGM